MRKLLAPVSFALALMGIALAGFMVSANAATAAVDDGSLLDLARPIFDQVMAGHYVAGAAFALILAVALLKRYAPEGRIGNFVHSDPGGALTTLLMAFGGALSTATLGGAPWSLGMLWMSLGVGFVAMGGYTAIKRLIIEPLLRPLMAKAPAWLQPAFALVLWIFDKPSTAVKSAEAAGTVAVAAKPGTGLAPTVGEPKDI